MPRSYQVTPEILGRRRATQHPSVRPAGRQKVNGSARRRSEDLPAAPWSATRFSPSRALDVRAPVSHPRPPWSAGWLASRRRWLVGELGLFGERAFGLAHRVVRRPDVAAALPARGAGGELEAAHLLGGERGLGVGVVLAAGEQAPEQAGELAG